MDWKVGEQTLTWQPKRVLIAGYTARDRAALQAHIDELAEMGIAPPPRIPMIYEVAPELLQQVERMHVIDGDSSGEAEVVLLHIGGKWYIGLGSDHTDRKLEAVSVAKSKQVCAKPISRELWPLNTVEHRWDDLQLQSYVVDAEGHEMKYQDGTLAAMMSPGELIEEVGARGFDLEDAALFCGTLPLIGGSFRFERKFRAQLSDPVTKKRLNLQYTVRVFDEEKEETYE